MGNDFSEVVMPPDPKIKRLQLGNYSNPDRHYEVGHGAVVSIEWFFINGEMAPIPCLRITFSDGRTREIRSSDWIVDYEL